MSFGLKVLAFATARIASAGVAAANDLKVALIYGFTGPLRHKQTGSSPNTRKASTRHRTSSLPAASRR